MPGWEAQCIFPGAAGSLASPSGSGVVPLKSSAALTCAFKMRDELLGLLGCGTRYFPFDSPFKLQGI